MALLSLISPIVFGLAGLDRAHAGIKECGEFLIGKRKSPFLTPEEKYYRNLLKHNPMWRPVAKAYAPPKASARYARSPRSERYARYGSSGSSSTEASSENLLLDIGYWWFPGNIWHDIIAPDWPDATSTAQREHGHSVPYSAPSFEPQPGSGVQHVSPDYHGSSSYNEPSRGSDDSPSRAYEVPSRSEEAPSRSYESPSESHSHTRGHSHDSNPSYNHGSHHGSQDYGSNSTHHSSNNDPSPSYSSSTSDTSSSYTSSDSGSSSSFSSDSGGSF